MLTFYRFLPVTASLLLPITTCLAQGNSTIKWQGYTWHVKSAESQGPGPNAWDRRNVFVDSNGFLHLRIWKYNGNWTCAEVWTDKPLGFGTYQCQVEGGLDQLDPNVVFSMFSYKGPDGVKEIDVEFAKWGNDAEMNAWWTVYPDDKTVKKSDIGFDLNRIGVFTTSRYEWTQQGVHYWLLGGHQPIGSLTNVIKQWDFKPQNPVHQVPQTPMPLEFNLWLFQGRPPKDGKPVEIVIHSFKNS